MNKVFNYKDLILKDCCYICQHSNIKNELYNSECECNIDNKVRQSDSSCENWVLHELLQEK